MAKEKKVVTTTTTSKEVKPKKAKTKKVTTTVTTVVTEETITTPLNDKTHIICILDRSGSMSSIMSDSIGGFNQFIKDQKKLPGEVTISIQLFDDKHEALYECANLKDVKEITNAEWNPRGTTALYDAIGKTINRDKVTLNRLGSEAPSKVLVCVVTDGFENASREYRREDVQKLIQNCEKEDWNFIYLAANQDAFAVGQSFGISAGNTFTYMASAQGVMDMSQIMYSATANYRSMDSNRADFKMKSKSLIDIKDDKKNPLDFNSGTITTNGIYDNRGIINSDNTNANGIITTNGNTTVTVSKDSDNITYTSANTIVDTDKK